MSGIIINEDNSHFFVSRPSSQMTPEGLSKLIDNYSGKNVKQINFCPNCMRVNYKSKVWDNCLSEKACDKELEKLTQEEINKTFSSKLWRQNCRILDDKGINPYKFWIKYSRHKAISPWISMRMNDVHNVDDPESWVHSDFWRNNSQWQRVPYFDNESLDGWFEKELDYGRKEVREYAMSLIKEYFELFDMDGLELDWMRFPYHFRPGHEMIDGEHLVDFMREVRELANQAAKRRKHNIKIAVRVPSDPDNAAKLGLDAVKWAELDLIDQVIPTPFLFLDTNIPITLWRRLLGDNIEIGAGLELAAKISWTSERVVCDKGIVSACAANYLTQGADYIYLFNYMDSNTAMECSKEFAQVLNSAGKLQTAIQNPRRYIVTFTDTTPVGSPVTHLLPCECAKNKQPVEAVLAIGKLGKIKSANALIKTEQIDNVAKLLIRINGNICKPVSQTGIKKCFSVDIEFLHNGNNLIEVYNLSDEEVTIVWIELNLQPFIG